MRGGGGGANAGAASPRGRARAHFRRAASGCRRTTRPRSTASARYRAAGLLSLSFSLSLSLSLSLYLSLSLSLYLYLFFLSLCVCGGVGGWKGVRGWVGVRRCRSGPTLSSLSTAPSASRGGGGMGGAAVSRRGRPKQRAAIRDEGALVGPDDLKVGAGRLQTRVVTVLGCDDETAAWWVRDARAAQRPPAARSRARPSVRGAARRRREPPPPPARRARRAIARSALGVGDKLRPASSRSCLPLPFPTPPSRAVASYRRRSAGARRSWPPSGAARARRRAVRRGRRARGTKRGPLFLSPSLSRALSLALSDHPPRRWVSSSVRTARRCRGPSERRERGRGATASARAPRSRAARASPRATGASAARARRRARAARARRRARARRPRARARASVAGRAPTIPERRRVLEKERNASCRARARLLSLSLSLARALSLLPQPRAAHARAQRLEFILNYNAGDDTLTVYAHAPGNSGFSGGWRAPSSDGRRRRQTTSYDRLCACPLYTTRHTPSTTTTKNDQYYYISYYYYLH